jgi:hypothetical protein
MRGTCTEFEVAAADQGAPTANLALTTDYVYFTARSIYADAPLLLRRVSRATLEHETLNEGQWDSVEALAASSARLYVLANYGSELWSMPLSGGRVRREEDLPESIDTIAAHGGYVYYTSDGSVYRRDESDSSVDEYGTEPFAAPLLAATKDGLFVAFNTDDEFSTQTYELIFLDRTWKAERLGRGPGGIFALTAFDRKKAYFMLGGPYDPGQSAQVMQAGDQEPIVNSRYLTDLVDLVGAGSLFTTVKRPFRNELWLFDVESKSHFEFQTQGVIERSASDTPGEIWFFDRKQDAVVRIDVLRVLLPFFPEF